MPGAITTNQNKTMIKRSAKAARVSAVQDLSMLTCLCGNLVFLLVKSDSCP